jgi:hypothetical protein
MCQRTPAATCCTGLDGGEQIASRIQERDRNASWLIDFDFDMQ